MSGPYVDMTGATEPEYLELHDVRSQQPVYQNDVILGVWFPQQHVPVEEQATMSVTRLLHQSEVFINMMRQ